MKKGEHTGFPSLIFAVDMPKHHVLLSRYRREKQFRDQSSSSLGWREQKLKRTQRISRRLTKWRLLQATNSRDAAAGSTAISQQISESLFSSVSDGKPRLCHLQNWDLKNQ